MEDVGGTYYREICSDAGKDLEDILDFANMVFSMSGDCIDFAAVYPKAYSENRCGLVTHHMIKEDGKIRALLDSYPLVMRLNAGQGADQEMEMKAVYIGTVSVHLNTRKRGYMTELMEHAVREALAQGCALVILDGNRHRYRPYGFEHAGIRYSFNIGLGNIRHCCAELYGKEYAEEPAYCFEEIDWDDRSLDYMYELYRRRNVTARNREDFGLCLQGGLAVTYAVIKADSIVGYVNLSGDEKNVLEFEVDESAEFPKIIYDLMTGIDSVQLGISVGMDETGKIEYLEKMCDYCNASMSHQIKILDCEAVLTFLFNWKQKYVTLVTSDYVIGVRSDKDSSIKKYLISVRENGTKVTRTDRAADTILGETELVRVLTTNLCFVEQLKGRDSKIINAPAGWFPLPFYLPDADAF